MKKVLAAVLFAAVGAGFTGCEDNPSTPDGGSPSSTDKTYYPLTQGSTWTYETATFLGSGTSTETIKGDTVINGKKYVKIVDAEDAEDIDYARRSNDTLFSLNEDMETETIMAIERVGASWTIQENEDGNTSTSTFTVTEKGVNRSVLNKTYSDVLHIHTVGYMTIEGESDTLTADTYLAKGVGMIENSSMLGTIRLKSYNIK